MSVTYINGRWYAAGEAKISVQDRGFRFGDGVFETIRIYKGKAMFLPQHLARLQEGLSALRITPPLENIALLCPEAIHKNQAMEGVLRITVSRGVGSQGYLPTATESTLVIEVVPLPEYQPPVTLWLSSYQRISPQALPVQYKLSQGLNSTLARMEAAKNGCDEALLLSVDGFISEASSACIFWQDAARIIYTPSLECGALAGIGRALLLERMEVQQGCFSLEALEEAHSVILINAVSGPRKVVALKPLSQEWHSTTLYNLAQNIWQSALDQNN